MQTQTAACTDTVKTQCRCVAGYRQTSTAAGAGSCTACIGGYAAAGQTTSCTACPAGTWYKSNRGYGYPDSACGGQCAASTYSLGPVVSNGVTATTGGFSYTGSITSGEAPCNICTACDTMQSTTTPCAATANNAQ